MAWERVIPRSGMKAGPHARVRMGIEQSGNAYSTGVYSARITIGAEIGRALGWAPKQRIVLERDPEARLFRLRLAGPDDAKEETFALVGAGTNSSTLGMRVSMQALRVFSPRSSTKTVPVEHRVDDGTIIVTPPAWAWEDAEVPTPPAAASPDPARDTQLARSPKSPPPAPPAVLVTLPLDHAMPAGVALPSLDDQVEAESMLRGGQGARALHEYFGWPLGWAQAYATAFREKQGARGKGRAA